MRRHRENRDHGIAIIVTGGGWPGDYDLVRALGHQQIRCAVASSDPHSIALHSRFVVDSVTLPTFESANYPEILALLGEFAGRFHTKPVLYYVGDSELLFVAQYADSLARSYRFLLPDKEILQALTNKSHFVQFARHYWLPVPCTTVVTSPDELAAKLDQIRFPCIVKPSFNRDWFWAPEQHAEFPSYKLGLRSHETQEQLISFCSRLPDWGSGLIIQDYLQGASFGTTSFLGYFDAESRCLGSFVGREIRNNPPVTGDTTYLEMIKNDEVVRLSIEYLRRIGMKGIVKIDYLWDAGTGEYKILEIEPHYQVWDLMGAYAGTNLAAIAYWDQRNELPSLREPRLPRTSLLHLRPDLFSYWTRYRKSGRWPFMMYFRSIFRKHCYRIFDLTDMRPFFVSLLGFWAKVYARMAKTGKAGGRLSRNRTVPSEPVSNQVLSKSVVPRQLSGVDSSRSIRKIIQ